MPLPLIGEAMQSRKTGNDVGLAELLNMHTVSGRRRVLLSLVQAIAFGPIAGWAASGAWFVLYVLARAVEIRVADSRRARVYGPRPKRVMAAAMVRGTVHSMLAVAAVINGGLWGLACGAILLSGGLLYAVVSSQRSRREYAMLATPTVLSMLLVAWLGAAQDQQYANAVSFVVIVIALMAGAQVLWTRRAEDIAASARASDEAERRRRAAENSAAAKSAFVAAVSHELRTPISAILAGAAAIERSDGDSETRANAALITEAGEMMRTLLNDLLDLSKMEAGRMTIETIDFELPALVSRTVAFWQAEASRKGLALQCQGLEAMPQWVAGDPTRLRQILNNLFSNAIKFTDAGEISLTFAAEQRGLYWVMRFSVSDSGRGMNEQQVSRLFKPFEQTQASTARTHGGTGLGLAISRELARLMGGDLDVVSTEGLGSIFTLEIGLVQVQHGEEEPVEDIEETSILVVDDHEVNRRAVSLMLEPFGVKLTAAASGSDALALLAAAPFDVVLMDMNMPGMSGCEATRRLRATPGPNQGVPVIAFTASSETADLAACAEAGMNGHVEKPIDPQALHAAIAHALAAQDGAQNETPRQAAGALG